jgi:hypothetical protein
MTLAPLFAPRFFLAPSLRPAPASAVRHVLVSLALELAPNRASSSRARVRAGRCGCPCSGGPLNRKLTPAYTTPTSPARGRASACARELAAVAAPVQEASMSE